MRTRQHVRETALSACTAQDIYSRCHLTSWMR
jgi:hypothetical protein